MQDPKFETTKQTPFRLARQPARGRQEETDGRGIPALQRDQTAQLSCRVGDDSCAGAHAETLRRSAGPAPDTVLRLQRRYGNRFVQRVMTLSRKGHGEADVTPEVEVAIQAARSGGQALDRGVRAQLEPAMGADFGGVRVYTDSQADRLNRALNARAFTTGRDIFFKHGEYNPGSSAGRELLAHELTHVMQQNGAQVQRKLTIGAPGDRYEQEADSVARAVMQREQQGAQWQVEAEEEEEDKSLRAKSIDRQCRDQGMEEKNKEPVWMIRDDHRQRLQRLLHSQAMQPLMSLSYAKNSEPNVTPKVKQAIHIANVGKSFGHAMRSQTDPILGAAGALHNRLAMLEHSQSQHKPYIAQELAELIRQKPLFNQRNQAGHISVVSTPLVQRSLREDVAGNWDAAVRQLHTMFIAVGGVVHRQMGAVEDFARYAAATDQPSTGEQALMHAITIVLGAVIPTVGNIIKDIVTSRIRESMRTSAGAIIDSMIWAGRSEMRQAVQGAWTLSGRSAATRLAQFAETQRRALEIIGQKQAESMNRHLAGLYAKDQDTAWATADAMYRANTQWLQTAYDIQFNKMTDTWFTIQTGRISQGAVPGVLRITLNRRYPDSGTFSIQGGNLLGSGANEEIRGRLAQRQLVDITIPKIIQMNGKMGWGIADCNWYIRVTGEHRANDYPTISAPKSGVERLTATGQHVVEFGGHPSFGMPWLAAFHLHLNDLSRSDPRNTHANQSAGVYAVWEAVKNLTLGSIGSSSW